MWSWSNGVAANIASASSPHPARTRVSMAATKPASPSLEALDVQVEIEGSTEGEAAFVAAMETRVRAGCGEDADAMLAATPLDQLHMGLARWRKKFG